MKFNPTKELRWFICSPLVLTCYHDNVNIVVKLTRNFAIQKHAHVLHFIYKKSVLRLVKLIAPNGILLLTTPFRFCLHRHRLRHHHGLREAGFQTFSEATVMSKTRGNDFSLDLEFVKSATGRSRRNVLVSHHRQIFWHADKFE